MGEVAVGGVDFGEEEACGGGALGGGGEVGDDFVHAGAVESVGEGVFVVKAEGGGGDDVGPATFVRAEMVCEGVTQGAVMLALRPAWASWMPGTLPCSLRKAVMRERKGMWSSE